MLIISRGLRACKGQGDARADFSILVARMLNSSETSMEEASKTALGSVSWKPTGGSLLFRMKKIASRQRISFV